MYKYFIIRVGICLFFCCSLVVNTQGQIITRFAGILGAPGYSGDGGPATDANIYPYGEMCIDAADNVYFADPVNSVIRKINAAGIISTYAGIGVDGFSGDGGPATAAALGGPNSVAIDAAGNLYISDDYNLRIRKVSPAGIITTVAGTGGYGWSILGNGGPATDKDLGPPNGICVDAAGNFYFSDRDNSVCYKVDVSTGIITHIAGNYIPGFSPDGFPATATRFFHPLGMAVDGSGNIYIADNSNNRVRKINAAGIVSTVAGTGVSGYNGDGIPAASAQLNSPRGVHIDASGNLLIADGSNARVREVNTSGQISTIAGTGMMGESGDGGPATAAQLACPIDVCTGSSGNIYIEDDCTHSIRVISFCVSPTVVVTPAAPTICSGQTADMTASGGTNYTWAPATGLSATTGATVTCSATTTTTYTVTGTSGTCVGTRTVTVSVNPTPTVTVTPAPVTICAGDNTSLTASGASQYSWAPATGLSATTGATVNCSAASTINYTVTGSTGSCTAIATTSVNVVPTLTINITPVSALICTGEQTDITATGAADYSWLPATGLSATSGATVSCTIATTTTYTVTGTTDGCSGTAIQTISVNPTPTVTATPAVAAICSGNTTTITAAGADTYSWFPTTGLSAGTGGSVTCSAVATTTYTVTGTTAGCSETAELTISVTTTPSVIVTPDAATICNGNSTGITAAEAASYSWAPAAGLSATTGAAVTCNASSTITYTVTGTNGACTGTATQTISVNPTPVLIVSPTETTICSADYTDIAVSGATEYSWSPATGLDATTGAVVECTANATVTYTVSGTTDGCTAVATQMISVNPTPAITITPVSASFCSGDNTDISASGGTIYNWYPGLGLSPATGSLVNCYATTTTVYTVTSTEDGCTGYATQLITVIPTPTLTVTAGSSTICSGNSTSMTASGGTSYIWFPATGLNTTTAATVTCSANSTISYSVISTNSGCTGITSKTINVNPTPTLTVTPAATVLCSGTNTVITATGADTYTWLPAMGLSATTGASVNCDINSSLIYTVTGTSLGCSRVKTLPINVTPSPTLTVTSDYDTICEGEETYLTVTGGGGPTEYTWAASPTLSSTGWYIVRATPTVTTTYSVSATVLGCAGATTKTIVVKPKPIISISPSSPTVCIGNLATFIVTGADSYSWEIYGAAYTASALQDTILYDPYLAGTWDNIAYGVTNGCYSEPDTISITTFNAPIFNVTTSTSFYVCPGFSTTMTATGFDNYTWAPAAGLSTTTGAVATCLPGASQVYTITGSSPGCTINKTQLVTLQSVPTVTVDADDDTICSGQFTYLNAHAGAILFEWSPSTSGTSPFDRVLCTPSTTTTYRSVAIFKLSTTLGSFQYCNDTAYHTITVKPTPSVAVFPPGDETYCANDTVTMTASGADTYTWDPPIYLSATTGSSVDAFVDWAHTVTYTLTGETNGCSASVQKKISMRDDLRVVIDAPTPFCEGLGYDFYAYGDATSFTWSPASGLDKTTGSKVHCSAVATTTYTLTGVNGTCTDSYSKTITIIPKPTITLSAVTPLLCTGQTTDITASGAVTYTWEPGTGLSAQTGTTVACTVPTTTIYTVTGVSPDGCRGTGTQTITSFQLDLNTNITNTGCGGANSGAVDLSLIGGTEPIEYKWNDNEITANKEHLAKGVYTVVVTDANNCGVTREITIDSSTGVEVNFLCPTRVVAPAYVHFTDVTFPKATAHHWSFGDPANSINIIDEDPDFLYQKGTGDSSEYEVTLIASNGGCVDTFRKKIWIINLKPGPGEEVSNELGNFIKLAAFPNPTQGRLSVDVTTYEATDVKLELFDIVGRKYYSEALTESKDFHQSIDLSSVPKGYYILKATSKRGTKTLKVVVY